MPRASPPHLPFPAGRPAYRSDGWPVPAPAPQRRPGLPSLPQLSILCMVASPTPSYLLTS